MNSKSSANKLKRPNFASIGFIIALVCIVLLLLFIFFPKETLLTNIYKQKTSDKVAYQYLQNLITLYPQDKRLKLLLIEQDIALGNVAEALQTLLPFLTKEPKTTTEWQALWCYYQIVHIQTYNQSKISYARKKGLLQLRGLIVKLAKGKLTTMQMAKLAKDAISLNETKTALSLYQRLSQTKANQKAEVYVNAAKFVLAHGGYKLSARLYFLAQQSTTDKDKQRFYFIQALKTLQSGDSLNEALSEARKHIIDLDIDKKTLLFLSQLALAANKTNIAQKYIKQALELKYTPVMRGKNAG